MKILLKCVVFMLALSAVILVSCQHEQNEIQQENPQNLDKNAELTGLLKRVAMTTGDNDNAIDSTSCVQIKMPYAITVHSQQGDAAIEFTKNITNPIELEEATTIISEFDDPEDYYFIHFPVTVVYENGEEQIVENQEVLNEIRYQCELPDPQSGSIFCFNLIYPITIYGYDSNFQLANTYTITSDEQLYGLLFNLNAGQFYAIAYPIAATNSIGAVININNNEELSAAIVASITDCGFPVIIPCQNPHILTEDLILYMPFQNEVRDLVSSTNASFSGNNIPQFVTDRNGNPKSAVSFSGSAFDFLKVSVNDENNIEVGDSLTVSLWFRMQDVAGEANVQQLFAKSEGFGFSNDPGFGLYITGNNTPHFISVNYGVGDGTWNTTLANDTTSWHHLALTIGDGVDVKLYRDGILVNDTNNIPNLFLNSQAADYYIGKYFAGYIDDIRVYRKVLSPQQIQLLYNLEGDTNTCL